MAIFIDTIAEFEVLPETIAEFELWTMTVAEFEAGFSYGAPPITSTDHINDLRFAALGNQGFTGHIDDRTLQWLRANGATSQNISDAWHEMLTAQGVPWTFHVNEGWNELLGILGYEGSLDDREKQFWEDGGNIGPSISPYPPYTPVASNVLTYAAFDTTTNNIQYRLDTDPFEVYDFLTNPDAGENAGAVASSLAGDYFALGTNNPQVWDTSVIPWVKLTAYSGINGTLRSLSFNGDGSLLFAGSTASRSNLIYETETPANNWEILSQLQVEQGAMSHNNQWLGVTVATGSPRAHLFDVTTMPPVALPALPNFPVENQGGVAMHPLLPIMVVGARNGSNIGEFRVYDLKDSLFIGSVTLTDFFPPKFLTFNNDGTRFAFSLQGGDRLYCYDVVDPLTPSTWVSLSIDNLPDAFVSGVAFSGDDGFLACTNGSGTPPLHRVYDMTQSPIAMLASFESSLPAVNWEQCVFISTEAPPPIVTNLVLANTVNNRIDATWSLGEPNVTSHTVEYKPTASGTWTSVNVGLNTSYGITGLASGEQYDVRVYATNAEGDGNPTPVEQIVVQGVPNQLQNFNVVSGIEQVSFSFDAGTGAPAVTSYRVLLKLATSTVWSEFLDFGFVTSGIIYGLSSQMYDFQAIAVNALGESVPATASAQPSAIGPALAGLFDEYGIDQASPVKFWLNDGTKGSDWDLVETIGTADNLLSAEIKGRKYINTLGDAALGTEVTNPIMQPYSVFVCVVPNSLTGTKKILVRDTIGAGFTDMTMATGLANAYAGTDLLLNTTIPTDGTEMMFSTDFNVSTGTNRLVLNDGATDVSATGPIGPNNLELDTVLWDRPMVANRDWIGDLRTFRIYDGILSAAEKQAVLGAIQQKYWAGFPYVVAPIAYPVNWSAMVQGLNNGGTVTNTLHNMSYGNRRWISVSDDGRSSTTFDDGATWQANFKGLNVGDDTASLRGIDNDDNNNWIVVTNSGWASRSTDNGDNWSQLPRGLNCGTGQPIFRAIISDKNETWLSLTSSGRASRSIDRGATWLTCPQGLNSGNTTLNWHNATSDGTGIFIAVGDDGYASRSDDYCATWAALPQGLGLGVGTSLYDIATDGKGNWIAVGNNGGATRSTDDGLTWTQILPAGLNCGNVAALFRTISTADGRGWVVTATDGWAALSPDGLQWGPLPKGLGTSGNPLFWGSDTNERGVWMVCGSGGQAATSTHSL